MFTELFTILPLTSAIFVFFFGLFVLSKDPKSVMNRLFFGFCLTMFFWMLGTFMMFSTRVTDVARAIFWDRFVYAGVVFMPSFMHHFSLLFTGRKDQRLLLQANYILSFLFLILSRTPFFVEDLYVYVWGAHTNAQILHDVFLGYFFAGTGLFFYNIWRHWRRLKDRQQRTQAIYVFLAFAIVIFIGGSAYLYAYGVDTKFPLAYFSGLVFPFILFYAITKHHLLAAKTIAVEVLVGLANFILITEIFLSRSLAELFLRVLFALVIGGISFLLIRSSRNEIARREEIASLANSLKEANQHLQELDKQKTDFLSIASHQLRTPLSILKGYIELIEDGAYGRPTKELRRTLRDMDQSNERLIRLVDEFLNISRIEQGRTEYSFAASDMNVMITGVVKEFAERAAAKGLTIIWQPNARVGKVYMDEEKIRHVLFNFVDNAIKYSERGKITVLLEIDGCEVTVRVKDQGIGFSEKKDRVNFFQKFYRGNNVKAMSVNGTGLGIYVCRKFIEAHMGRVCANSLGLRRGSEFCFTIPVKQDGSSREVAERSAA